MSGFPAMKATLVQCDLKWEDRDANLAHVSSLLDIIAPDSGIVVLPEMFTTGFTMNPSPLAEDMDGHTVRWMKERAAAGGYALCGSVIIGEEGLFYNRLIFVTPSGRVTFYDKRHLHTMSGEHTVYSRGNKRVVVPYREFSFNLQVCYDLRFPVWSRNRGDTDVIIYSANWPAVRSSVWKALLVARAIENQCYVIGVNRVGVNPDGTSYTGDSAIIGPKGELLASLESAAEGVVSAVLPREALDRYREDMPIWRDADPFELI
ncbi:MAG: amidohydrolase [Bacteroidales bacterium]|nr:amidohydrolase [Bacteroidales bacterium]NLD64417.1 amidohydrolase [Bacteroidales bacterium]